MASGSAGALAPAGRRFPIIAIGASAGGLEALIQFLSHVPAHSGAAYVIVQHLDPTHASLLVGLLQRSTAMTVTEITERQPVLADHVYVIPPDRRLSIECGVLHLHEPDSPRGQRMLINDFFGSLADDQQQDAIGVILSGSGCDGTLGLLGIKQWGGLTAAQDPVSAGVDAMPRAAIAAGVVDMVAPAGQLPDLLLKALDLPGRRRHFDLSATDPDQTKLALILEQVQQRTGHGFSLYKKSAVYRRIERRMGNLRLATLGEYRDVLEATPSEGDQFVKELLIGVTAFFRDGDVWEHLSNEVIPELVRHHPEGGVMRAWCAGCASGEEAYSLAMIMCEALERLRPAAPITVQIFATDLKAEAIDRARRGVYPASIATTVSAERLQRFFSRRPTVIGSLNRSAIW